MAKDFILAGNVLIHVDNVNHVDFSKIEDLKIVISYYASGPGLRRVEVSGPQAIEVLMALKPSALESRRLRWARRAWAVHNLVGHPLMQVLSFFRMYGLAMWVHDKTVPRPQGAKP